MSFDRLAAGNEERLASRIALRSFGDTNQRNIRDPKRGECLARGIELAEAAVDQEEIGPGGFGRLLQVRFARLEECERGGRGSRYALLECAAPFE